MKTTMEINDDLLADAKAFAATHKTSLRRVLEDALILFVRRQGKMTKGRTKLRKHAFHGEGLRPQVRDMAPSDIRELAYEGRGGMEVCDHGD